jgi:hypothetical protein
MYYSYYGGRGITVCDRWSEFAAFLEDMGSSWAEGLTLDRIEVQGNYEPSNCRWATRAEQNLNKSNAIRISWGGETLSIAEWSAKTGITENALRLRHAKGLSAEDVLRK